MTFTDGIIAPVLVFLPNPVARYFRTFFDGFDMKSGNQRPKSTEPVLDLSADTLTRSAKTLHSRPLRMVRVMEVGELRSNAGRMVISGRMADVCAELDRMVARESASAHAAALSY